jgi:sugar phosphate isomerase/epimerase
MRPVTRYTGHTQHIVSTLIQKRKVPDGSIFDTIWLIFMRHLAHFYLRILLAPWHFYIDNIFKNIKSDRLKFCYDSGHENCFTPGADFLAKYGDKLAALHHHDNDGSSDQHLLPFM